MTDVRAWEAAGKPRPRRHMIREMSREGKTDREIAAELGWELNTLKAKRYAMGLECNPRETWADYNVRDLYLQGLSYQEIGARRRLTKKQVENKLSYLRQIGQLPGGRLHDATDKTPAPEPTQALRQYRPFMFETTKIPSGRRCSCCNDKLGDLALRFPEEPVKFYCAEPCIKYAHAKNIAVPLSAAEYAAMVVRVAA